MKPLSDFFTVQRFRFLGIRLSLCVAALLVYLLLWRPVRVMITDQLVYPQVQYFDKEAEMFESRMEAGALLVVYEYGDSTKQLQYRPQFGFFFLVALAALFFVTSRKRPYLILGGLHLAGSVLAYLFLMSGALGFRWGFVLTDALSGYLIPALTLGLVPLVVRGFVE